MKDIVRIKWSYDYITIIKQQTVQEAGYCCKSSMGASSTEYEIDTTNAARTTIWLIYMLCRRYSIWIRNICLMYNYSVYNNLFWIFLIQMEYPSAKHV